MLSLIAPSSASFTFTLPCPKLLCLALPVPALQCFDLKCFARPCLALPYTNCLALHHPALTCPHVLPSLPCLYPPSPYDNQPRHVPPCIAFSCSSLLCTTLFCPHTVHSFASPHLMLHILPCPTLPALPCLALSNALPRLTLPCIALSRLNFY